METPPTFRRSLRFAMLYYIFVFTCLIPSCFAFGGHHLSPRIAIVWSLISSVLNFSVSHSSIFLISCHVWRSRMTMNPRIPTMPGRSTSGFHRPARRCLDQARSAVRCSASGMKGWRHLDKNRARLGVVIQDAYSYVSSSFLRNPCLETHPRFGKQTT